jgi:hypothetical protein
MATEGTKQVITQSAPAARPPPKPLAKFVRDNPELCLGIVGLFLYVIYNLYQIATGTGRWKILYKNNEL